MFKIRTFQDRNGHSAIDDLLYDLDKRSKTDKSARIRLRAISRYMSLLEESGTQMGFPAVRHIEGDIWELRPIDDRIFFAYWKDNVFVLLHHYVKKSQKTPKRELDQAKRNLRVYLERKNENV
jgi:phage-related protein